VKEKLKHIKAFNFFYSLGKKRCRLAVAEKFKVSVITISSWATAFNWKARIRQREAIKDGSATGSTNNSKLVRIRVTGIPSIDRRTHLLISAQKHLNGKINGKKIRAPGAGRKTKLTPALQDNLLEAINVNNLSLKSACQLCGITDVTYFVWMREGKAEEQRIMAELEKRRDEAIAAKQLNFLDPPEMERFIEAELQRINPSKFFYLRVEVKKAEAKAELANLGAIRNARDGGHCTVETRTKKNTKGDIINSERVVKHVAPQWSAAAWLLERKYPDRYGRRFSPDSSDSSVSVNVGIAIIPEQLSQGEWEKKYSSNPSNLVVHDQGSLNDSIPATT
jgi:hypothetical protein